MILVLCGFQASGKTTIRDKLVQDYGYEKIITYTDRPPRPIEKDGVDYHFVAPEVFDSLVRSNFFIETTAYQVAVNNSIWRYGTPRDVFINENDNPYRVIILNPRGIQSLSYERIDNQYCICQLMSNEKTIRSRLKQRGDDLDEIERRMKSDLNDFYDFKFDILTRNNLEDDIDKVTKDVHRCYQYWKAGKE